MDKQIMRIDDNDFKMVELLRTLNLSRPVALTLTCLSNIDEATSREIEMYSGLRQPEVSIAVRYMNEYNWIDIREEKKTEGKGRPIKLYKLLITLENVISTIENDMIEQHNGILENIKRLKYLS